MYAYKKIAEGALWIQKHSEARPQSGHVYNYKALQRVAGEPAVLDSQGDWEQFFFLYMNI